MSAIRTDEIKQRAVMVNNGSGVLVSALSTDYSYVLTARHNLLRDPKSIDSLLELDDIVVISRNAVRIPANRVLISETRDVAVILVESQPLEPTATSPSVRMEESMWLVGYPRSRRNLPDPIRLFRGAIESFNTDLSIDVSTSSFAHVDEVRGTSGGGVYTVIANRWVLVAIEYEMEGQPEEGHNWLRCTGIAAFDELIREHSLAPILPPFLLSFGRLSGAAFPLPGFECLETLQRLRTVLLDVIQTSLDRDSPTPSDILEAFGRKLLVKEDPDWSLIDRKLWVSWLEYLILSVLLDEPQSVDAEYIESLQRRRRFLYSSSDREWTEFIDRIIQSDLVGLEPNGLILVSNRKEGSPAKTRSVRDLSRIVPDIGLPIGALHDIANPRRPVARVKLLHLDGLHMDCIVRREDSYRNELGMDDHTVLQLLAEAYREAIAQ